MSNEHVAEPFATILDQTLGAYADCVAAREAGDRGLGLNDPAYGRRSLQWRATDELRNDDPELSAALKAIGAYNAFDGEAVAWAFQLLNCAVTIAREYSVCLYIKPLETQSKAIKDAMAVLGADEIDEQTEPGTPEYGVIRAWWD